MQRNPAGFSVLSIVLVLAGTAVIVFSFNVVYVNVYPVLFWEKTTANITGTVSRYDNGVFYEYEQAVFVDNQGRKRTVTSSTSAGESDYSLPAEGTVTVYYDPLNSEKSMIFMWRNLLGVLMLPFGLLLLWFGLPEKRTAATARRPGVDS